MRIHGCSWRIGAQAKPEFGDFLRLTVGGCERPVAEVTGLEKLTFRNVEAEQRAAACQCESALATG